MSLAIANRYARALADLVFAPSSPVEPEQAIEQLRTLESLLTQSRELHEILLTPAVPPPRKRAVVSRLAAESGVTPLVRNFLFVVIDHRRTAMLGDIRQAFEVLLDERLGIVRANVSSAHELTGTQQERLRDALARVTGKQVRCGYSVESDLLGGLLVRVGSRVYDGSVRGQLEALRHRLVEE
jgi:F-type H+-transporting ATPase subunit delta